MNFDENDGREPITTPDTENKTKINAIEGTDPVLDKNGEGKWKRLSRINTGAADSFGNRNESVTRKQERANAFDVIGDRLGMIGSHKREGREIMMNQLDTEALSRPGSTVHLIAFCVAAYLINRDDLGRHYHPERRDENNDQFFLDVQEQFGFENDMINSLMQKVEKQL